MASSENNDHSRKHDDENPFVAFRRMIDEHLSSVVRALNEQTGIVSAVGHDDSRSNTDSRGRNEAPDDTHSRLFGIFSQPPFHERVMQRQAYKEEEEEERESKLKSRQVWPCLTKTTVAGGPGHQTAELGICPLYSYEWWRQYSPYSPVNLAKDASGSCIAGFAHRAFSDLLALHNGEDMSYPYETRPNPPGDNHAQKAWDLHLTEDKRGAVWRDRPVWNPQSLFRPIMVLDTAEKVPEKDVGSEEDMYRWFLGQQAVYPGADPRGPAEHASKEQAAAMHVADIVGSANDTQQQRAARHIANPVENAQRPQKANDGAQADTIISTLTTTHRITAPDGTVTTIRKFKQTFADGYEEEKEDTQVLKPVNAQATAAVQPSVAPTESSDYGKKKSGWFWN